MYRQNNEDEQVPASFNAILGSEIEILCGPEDLQSSIF